jgi:hypothetical protein
MGCLLRLFEGFQLQAGDVASGENLVGGGIDFAEVGRANVTLKH